MDAPQLVALALLTSGSRVLLERRPDDGSLPGLWQFPGGKVEFGEHPWEALRRELREELGLRAGKVSLFGVYSHVYELGGNRVHYVLLAYRIPLARGRVRERADLRWVPTRGLRGFPIVPGSKPIVEDLLRASRKVT